MTVRTRIAPSPTGDPHIGTAYNALFNYAFAHSRGGRFVLRIEDTDRARSTRESEAAILAALQWLGLNWDEGPDTGGPCGPYRQSERTELYRAHGEALVRDGRAYPCFCSEERLKALRAARTAAKEEFVGYDGRCAELSEEESRRRVAAGESHVIRLRVPGEGECVMGDGLRGEIRIPWRTVDDQVLLKADRFPTYHLANVVDDHLMAISHVIRGEEWISSLPKHVLLYEAFGWDPPAFLHLPLLRNPDKSKVSKRKNPTSVFYYRQAGFLPEALVNFLGLMAYSPADGEEIFSLEKFTAGFDIGRVSLGGPVFDLQKLRHFNGRYIRGLSPDELWRRLEQWRLDAETWRKVVPLAQPRLSQLSDFVPAAAFLFADRLAYDADALAGCAGGGDAAVRLLRIAQWEVERAGAWTVEGIRALFTGMAETEDRKLKDLLPLFFIAVCGAPVSLPLFESMEILGRDLCLRRIQYALEALAGIGISLSGKKLKKLSGEYEQQYRKE